MRRSAGPSVMLRRGARRVALMLVRASRLLLFLSLWLAPLLLVSPGRAVAADAGVKAATPPQAASVTGASTAAAAKGAAAKAAPAKGLTAKTSKKPKAPKNPPVVLFTVNHKETFSLRL